MKLAAVVFCLLAASITAVELEKKQKQQQVMSAETEDKEKVVPVLLMGVSAGLAAANCAMVFAEIIVHQHYMKSIGRIIKNFAEKWKVDVEAFDLHIKSFQASMNSWLRAMADLKNAATGKEIKSARFRKFLGAAPGTEQLAEADKNSKRALEAVESFKSQGIASSDKFKAKKRTWSEFFELANNFVTGASSVFTAVSAPFTDIQETLLYKIAQGMFDLSSSKAISMVAGLHGISAAWESIRLFQQVMVVWETGKNCKIAAQGYDTAADLALKDLRYIQCKTVRTWRILAYAHQQEAIMQQPADASLAKPMQTLLSQLYGLVKTVDKTWQSLNCEKFSTDESGKESEPAITQIYGAADRKIFNKKKPNVLETTMTVPGIAHQFDPTGISKHFESHKYSKTTKLAWDVENPLQGSLKPITGFLQHLNKWSNHQETISYFSSQSIGNQVRRAAQKTFDLEKELCPSFSTQTSININRPYPGLVTGDYFFVARDLTSAREQETIFYDDTQPVSMERKLHRGNDSTMPKPLNFLMTVCQAISPRDTKRVTNWSMRLLLSHTPGAPITNLVSVPKGGQLKNGYVRVPSNLRAGKICPEHRLDLAYKKNYKLESASMQDVIKRVKAFVE